MACAVTALPILVLLMEKRWRSCAPRWASASCAAPASTTSRDLGRARGGADGLGADRAPGHVLVAFALATAFRRLMRAIPERDRWYAMLVWLAVCVRCRLVRPAFHGRRVPGRVVMDRDWFDHDALDRLRQHVLLLLVPVSSPGHRAAHRLGDGRRGRCWRPRRLLVASVAGKLAGVRLAGRLLGWPAGDAALVGWLLQTKGTDHDHLRQRCCWTRASSQRRSLRFADSGGQHRADDADGPRRCWRAAAKAQPAASAR